MPSFQKRKYSDGSVAFIAWVRVSGFKPISKSFPTKKEASQWASELERDLRSKRKLVRSDLTRLTVRQLIAEFREDPEVRSLRTFSSFELLLAWWDAEYGHARALEFCNPLLLREAREKLRPGRAPATVNRYLSAMRSCWNWARAAALVPDDRHWPTRLMLTEPKGRTRYLRESELTSTLNAAAGHSKLMFAAVMVSIACGVRQSELLRLKWSDVDLDGNRLRVSESKNGESRTVYLPEPACDALRELKRAPVVAVHVFVNDNGELLDKNSIEARWKKIRAAASLVDFRWHDLRHSCASFLAQQGANLLEIGSVLGHKSPSMTKRYSHLIEGAPVTGHTKLGEKLRGSSK